MSISIFKRIIVIVAAIIMITTACSFRTSAFTILQPRITITSPSRGTILVHSSNVSNKSGYQIRYGKTNNYKNCKIIKVTTSGALNKSIRGLSVSKRYYVAVRAYKLINGKRIYGKWSTTKSCVTRATNAAYVNAWRLNLETSKKSTTKYSTDSLNYTALYMDKIYVYGSLGPYSKNQWIKVKYNGKIKYTYVNVARQNDIFTRHRHPFTYDFYEKYCTSDLQRSIVGRALAIYSDRKNNPVIYDYSHSTYLVGEGIRHELDCSTFARYVINEILGGNFIKSKSALIWDDAKNNKCMYCDDDIKIYIKKIAHKDLQPGDMVCFDDNKDQGVEETDWVDHIGIYLGNNEFIQSTKSYIKGVNGMIISPLSGKYYARLEKKRFVGAGRVVIVENEPEDKME